MSEPRSLVLDANILIRAVLGVRVRGTIERHALNCRFFAPQLCVDEARRHLPSIIAKRHGDVRLAETALERTLESLNVADPQVYAGAMTEAQARLAARDPFDADVLALALTLECPIWTEDRDFFGTGVATWTSAQVERYLAPAYPVS